MVVDNNSWIKGDITSGRLMFNGHSEGTMMVKAVSYTHLGWNEFVRKALRNSFLSYLFFPGFFRPHGYHSPLPAADRRQSRQWEISDHVGIPTGFFDVLRAAG